MFQNKPKDASTIFCAPLTSETWPDFVRLFGPRGACGGCWCMTWRLRSADYERMKGSQNKAALQRLVRRGEPIGIIAYQEDIPIGWCSVAPRSAFSRLNRSRLLRPVDELAVWSIVCLFVNKSARRNGVSRALITHAVNYAAFKGAGLIEAYPVEPRNPQMPDLFAFTGIASVFQQLGFKEVARRGSRPIMRKSVRAEQP